MSYTAPDQLLSDSIDKLLENVVDVRQRMQNRIADPCEWSATHLLQLAELCDRLTRLQLDLGNLRDTTR